MQIIERNTDEKKAELLAELTRIANQRSGLNPTTLLQEAEKPTSILHQYFTWDDTEAARKWREVQAYYLIRRVKVTVQTPDKKELTIRAFFPVKQVETPIEENDETNVIPPPTRRGDYMPIQDVINDKNAIQQVILSAISELRAFQNKYHALKTINQFADLFAIIGLVTQSNTHSQQ